MAKYRLTRSDDRDVRFSGECLGTACTFFERGVKREYSLYLTDGKQYVCENNTYTQWEGHNDYYEVRIFQTLDQVIDYFGDDDLAKELYEDANIDASVSIA